MIAGKDCIQIKAASKEILDKRIEAFLQRKSEEGRQLTHRVLDGECSRTLPVRSAHGVCIKNFNGSHSSLYTQFFHRYEFILRSYRHIGVEYTRNEAGPGAQGMKPTVVPEERSIENRISAIETQLGLGASSTTNLLCRMKHIEDRLLYLESVSPEYQRLK